jgi:hypothetical protein
MPIFKGPFPLNVKNIDAEFSTVAPVSYRVGPMRNEVNLSFAMLVVQTVA